MSLFTLNTINDFLSTTNVYNNDIAIVADKQKTGGNSFVFVDYNHNPPNPIEVLDNQGNLIGGLIYRGYNNSGVWVMMYEGDVNVQWLGAVGDGNYNNAADTNAFQAAIDNRLAALFVPSTNNYYVLDAITIPPYPTTDPPAAPWGLPINIYGDHKIRAIIVPFQDNISIFKCCVGNVNIQFLDFQVKDTSFTNVVAIELYYEEYITPTGGLNTINECSFWGLRIGIYNNSITDQASTKITQSGSDEIKSCLFYNCTYGIYSNGGFITSNIHDSRFFACKSGISIYKSPYFNNTTEGLMIDNCVLFQCGDIDDTTGLMAAIYCQASYTYITNTAADQSFNHALYLDGSWEDGEGKGVQYCRLSDCWFASDLSINKSTFKVRSPMLDMFVNNCNFADSTKYGIELILSDDINNSLPSLNITISNSSILHFNPPNTTIGCMYVYGVENVVLNNCNLYQPPSGFPNWCSAVIENSDTVNSSLFLDACYVISTNFVKIPSNNYPNIDVRLHNCYNRPTIKEGIATIKAGHTEVSFAHGLTVLDGQYVCVIATNSSSFATVTAGLNPSNPDHIRLITEFAPNRDLEINYQAKVYNKS